MIFSKSLNSMIQNLLRYQKSFTADKQDVMLIKKKILFMIYHHSNIKKAKKIKHCIFIGIKTEALNNYPGLSPL